MMCEYKNSLFNMENLHPEAIMDKKYPIMVAFTGFGATTILDNNTSDIDLFYLNSMVCYEKSYL